MSDAGGPPRPAAVVDWLLREGWRIADAGALFEGLCRNLVAAGVPLWRAVVQFGTLHPLYLGHSLYWWRDRGLEEVPREHAFETSPEFLTSPYKRVIDTGRGLRRRLDGRRPRVDSPILEAVRAAGGTDYVIEPLPFTGGVLPAVSWTTDRPGGFSGAELRLLRRLPPVLAPALEVRALRRTAAALLDTYLGRGAGREVLSGAIRRGDHRRIEAAVLAADLRGFTAKAVTWPEVELLAALDAYFELLVDAVTAEGGDVLKFMGDGLLAIVPVAAATDGAAGACRRALAAAARSRQGLGPLNRERAEAGREPLDFVVALDVGRVVYGNIGGRARLDFTVIGPPVNLTSRLLELAKRVGRPVLASAAFAREAGGGLASIGRHPIRGLDGAVEVFASADDGR